MSSKLKVLYFNPNPAVLCMISYHLKAGPSMKVTRVLIDDVVAMFANVEPNKQIITGKTHEPAYV